VISSSIISVTSLLGAESTSSIATLVVLKLKPVDPDPVAEAIFPKVNPDVPLEPGVETGGAPAPKLTPVEAELAAGVTAPDDPPKVKPDVPELDAGAALLLKAKPEVAAPIFVPPTADDPPKVKPLLPMAELEEAVLPTGV
jgi:hypothetical protein